jgi:maltooligosyltrehalose trehalohydrolase
MAQPYSLQLSESRDRSFASTFGAMPTSGGTRFRVWAPNARTVDVVIEDADRREERLQRSPDGTYTAFVAGVFAGTRYWYRLDDGELLPDPASRFQADGVHGPSTIVDPGAFTWTDARWAGVALPDLVLYEVHVGTFTEEGTFRGLAAKLDDLVALGITAIELMPIAETAGRWNWGYDNVDLFAPSHNYGTPDDLRGLVDAAHARGLAVIFDVVYNHLGPDGAHVYRFSPSFRTDQHQTPWGPGVNLDGPDSEIVRAFLLDNALHWIHEYHADGLRVDATHAMADDSPRPFLTELSDAVHTSVTDRHVLLIAEDERNEAALVTAVEHGGHGFDAVWADDLHHQVRRAIAGDCEGYFQSYSGTTQDIAETLRRGWFFTGQFCPHKNAPRGTVPIDIALSRFVVCLQNHDQIGNRALGERLHHQVDLSTYRALSALLLLAPETPLLFMGQEWAATSPYLYFTDHEPTLGRAITEGRRGEFAAFSSFSDPAARATIPDPQDRRTFEASRLRWHEQSEWPHEGVLRLYTALLHLRRELVRSGANTIEVDALDDDTLMMIRSCPDRTSTAIVVRLRGHGSTAIPSSHTSRAWHPVLTTEDVAFAHDGRPPVLVTTRDSRIQFSRPSAIVMRSDSGT